MRGDSDDERPRGCMIMEGKVKGDSSCSINSPIPAKGGPEEEVLNTP